MGKVILLDMDDVLMDFKGGIVDTYNATHDDQISREMITHWDFSNFPKPIAEELDQLWRKPGFFKSLKPLNDALEYVPKLMEEHECFIASDAFDFSYTEKDHSLKTYFPMLLHKKFYGREKWRITSDFLIDDKIDTLNKYHLKTGVAICYNQYHNLWDPSREENWTGLRINNLRSFYELLKG
jgi:5'(3')-deoxyribonucleotidase